MDFSLREKHRIVHRIPSVSLRCMDCSPRFLLSETGSIALKPTRASPWRLVLGER
jgi:hypothetical protein